MSETLSAPTFPHLAQVVLDAVDIRALAEFYRQLLGYEYRAGDEPGAADRAEDEDWLVLNDPAEPSRGMAFQQVEALPEATWPEGPVPQQLHLDMTVPSVEEFDRQHERARSLGARMLLDRSDDPKEPLRVYADPAGHPFCIFVAPT
jgi:catechol 2,3-dioxygenase-like lactoylglutathione lyase family enzyme